MQKKLREEIIGMILSKSLREYLLAVQEEVTDEILLKTVGAAPVSLEKKRECLIRCTKDMETEAEIRIRLKNTLKELETALFRLHHTEKNDILMLERHVIALERGLAKDRVESGCWLMRDFAAAKRHMEQEDYYGK